MKPKQVVPPILILLAGITILSACGRIPRIVPPTAFPSYQNNGMPPLITSPDQAIFTIGEAGTFTITVSGSPFPSLSTSGDLPGGLSLNPLNNGQAILSGNPINESGGTYSLALKARNGFLPDAEQILKVLILKAKTTVNFEFPAKGLVAGNTDYFTVTVTSALPVQSTPTGLITLLIDDGTTVFTPLVNGKAVFDSSSLKVGKHTLQAGYSGDPIFSSSTSASIDQNIAEAPSGSLIYLPVISAP